MRDQYPWDRKRICRGHSQSQCARNRNKCAFCRLLPGRAGLFWFHEQIKQLGIAAKSPRSSIGVRFETRASFLQHAAKRHPDFKVSIRHDRGKTKSFCFCAGPAGGRIKFVDYGTCVLLDGHVAVEGSHADVAPDRISANFALLEQLPEFDPDGPSHLEVLKSSFIERYRRMRPDQPGKPVCQSFGDFRKRHSSGQDWKGLRAGLPFEPSANDLCTADLHRLFDDRMHGNLIAAFEQFWQAVARGEDGTVPDPDENVLVIGLELESLWDVLELTPHMETSKQNLFVVGDSSGIAQGILQAATGGISAAFEIARRINSTARQSRRELGDAIVYDKYWTTGQHMEPSQTVCQLIDDLIRSNGAAPVVADLGCGIGRHALHALKEGCTVLAVDHHERAVGRLEALVREAPGLKDRLSVVCGDMVDAIPPAINGTALDGIVMFDCVHHLASDADNTRQKLTELLKSLRPGGGIVISLLTDIDYGAGDLPHRRLLLSAESGDAFLETCFASFDCVTRKQTDVWFETSNYCSDRGAFIDTYYSAKRLIRYYRKRSAVS